MTGSSTALVITGLDFAFSFLFCLFIVGLYNRIDIVIESSQRKIVSPADYTVFVRGLSRGKANCCLHCKV